jgi:hypothetical protein
MHIQLVFEARRSLNCLSARNFQPWLFLGRQKLFFKSRRKKEVKVKLC